VIGVLQFVLLLLVAGGSVGVVTSHDPTRQAIAASFYGLLLALLFFLFQAPDVALSQLVVGVVAWPLMIMLTVAKVRGGSE
jgi:energy-converting hydrogenase B subunit D